MTQAATQIAERPSAGLRLAPALRPDAVPTALLVECTCPEWCERDHDRD